jgi:endonuclease/exonuclease/phosphatase family metal-dependent hydrolase
MTRKKVTVSLLIVLISALHISVSGASETITIMAANLTTGNFQSYEEQGIRLFQGLKPDIVLIQEFNYRNGTRRDFVDEAFGTEFFFMVEPGSLSIPTGIISRFPIIDSGSWNDPTVPDRNFSWAVIDIPGDIQLQCVSVHFKGGSGPDDKNRRAEQAQSVMFYIDENFNPDAYIVLGGDLNTWSETEAALTELADGLQVDSYIPVDQSNNENTNEPRNRQYDWVIPNVFLDALHVPLVIGSNTFENGMVFDSYVYTPLDEVPPIQYGDSHDNSIQHMPVMKAFQVPVSTPTPSSTPTPTPTTGPGEPTNTPQPTITPTPTATLPTATPACTDWSAGITMPAEIFAAGDLCYCYVHVCNPADYSESGLPLFVILDVYGTLFFGPDFSEFNYYRIFLPPGWTFVEVLPEFYWPDDVGSAMGIRWYAALTDPDITRIVGQWDMFEFGWE